MTNQLKEIKPITIPGVHRKFFHYFKKRVQLSPTPSVLDLGAGHGALSKMLVEAGLPVAACDLFPENFYYDQVTCKFADITQTLPYDDHQFDIIVAVEVTEHIIDHEVFFAECARVLKPGGLLMISTPNIVSLKSRCRFCLTGFPYSFEPIDFQRNDGLQHLSALTFDQYAYVGHKYHLTVTDYSYDVIQNASFLMLWLWPLLWLGSLYLKVKPMKHNAWRLLLARILFITYEKAS